MYTDRDFRTKASLKRAVANGDRITIFQPGGMSPAPRNGQTTVEGPHGYHKWYARVTLKDGRVVKVK